MIPSLLGRGGALRLYHFGTRDSHITYPSGVLLRCPSLPNPTQPRPTRIPWHPPPEYPKRQQPDPKADKADTGDGENERLDGIYHTIHNFTSADACGWPTS